MRYNKKVFIFEKEKEMDKTIRVMVTKLFGEKVILPEDDIGKTFCNIAGVKSFTNDLIETLKSRGYKIVEINKC